VLQSNYAFFTCKEIPLNFPIRDGGMTQAAVTLRNKWTFLPDNGFGPTVTSSSLSVGMGLETRYLAPLAPSPDELKPYVLKGVWERYDESAHKWTLENFSALLVVACLTAFIAFAQSQCWSLLRYIIAQYAKSPRLPGDSRPDPLLELSQGQAIISVMPLLSRWTSKLVNKIRRPFRAESRHARDTRVPDEPLESPYFGVAAIINICFFLVMGVAIPWWLTEGALGAPIVKSRITEDCLSSIVKDHWVDTINRLSRADEIFRLCQDRLDAGCDSPYHLSTPQITKTRSTACPFKGYICLKDSFEITHWNISAFEIGVNSRSKLLLNRRLTCAPVSLNPFLSRPPNSSSFIYVKKAYFNQTVKMWPNISLILSTKNGPDRFSNEDSGLRMVQEDGPHDLTILPWSSELDEPNELMKRNDGVSFLVIYRAGRRLFPNMIQDPFFAAHRQASFPWTVFPDYPSFYPDHEATALGCVEQFQYCFPPSPQSNPCTGWGSTKASFSAMHDSLAAQFPGGFNGDVSPEFEQWNGQVALSLKEMLALFQYVYKAFEVQDYLVKRTLVFNMVPLIKWGTSMTDYSSFEIDREPWVAEVETWFMKAWLSGILMIQDGAIFTILDLNSSFSSEYLREWKLCGRILFHNEDFTNIDWIWLWVTIASLMLLCLVGNQVHIIHKGLKNSLAFLSIRIKVVISWLRKLLGTIRSLRRPATWFNKPVTIWSAFWPLNGRSSGGGSGPNENSDGAEMDDLEELPATPRQDNFSNVEEYEDIDNPI
jgi:hypothetical protein